MDDYYFIFFIFSVLIFFISVLISNDKLGNNLSLLKMIKNVSLLGPTIASGIIVMFLFKYTIYNITNNSSVGIDSVVISSGLSIFGILATVWIGLNIYNTIEKKDLENVIEFSKNEIQMVTKKLEDIAKIQVEFNIADFQENIDEKIMRYKDIVNKYESYDLPFILRANFMFKIKRYEEAVSDYNIALLKNNENSYLYYDRGKCYYHMKKYDKAIDDFTKTINLDLFIRSSMKNRAVAYQNIECYDKAISDYTQIINMMDPDDITYNNRGICNLKTDRYALALGDFNKAIQISNGKDRLYYQNRIATNMLLYNFVEVIRDIDTIIEKFNGKDEGDLYLLRGNVNKSIGNYKDADLDYKLYKKLKKNDSKNDEEAAMSKDEEDDKQG